MPGLTLDLLKDHVEQEAGDEAVLSMDMDAMRVRFLLSWLPVRDWGILPHVFFPWVSVHLRLFSRLEHSL